MGGSLFSFWSYWAHFTDGEWGSQKLSNLPKLHVSLLEKESSPGVLVLRSETASLSYDGLTSQGHMLAHLMLMIMVKLMSPMVFLKYKCLNYHAISVLFKVISFFTVLLTKILSYAQLQHHRSVQKWEVGVMNSHWRIHILATGSLHEILRHGIEWWQHITPYGCPTNWTLWPNILEKRIGCIILLSSMSSDSAKINCIFDLFYLRSVFFFPCCPTAPFEDNV